ncbi:MAG: TonB-dependent receptor [Bryobacterales bacterium]|nr:TonB-dependent receptor [Bryobacterales bacterium]
MPEPLWNGQVQAWDTEAFRVSEDWTISPNMVNHFSWTKNTFTKNSFSANVDKNWKDKVCIKNVVDCNQNFPTINFTDGLTSWGSASYNGTHQPGWGLKNDLSYIRGSHTLKFGFQHQNQNADGFGQQDIAGRADFNFLGTSIPGATSWPNSGGAAFASFLLGDAHLGRTETIRAVTQKYPYFGFYAQDDWRITRKLTVNIGLRYDLTLPPTNKKDEYSDFNPARPNPGADGLLGALWFAGFGEGRENRRSLVPGWYAGWGPRIGIAYTPDSKTTFRTAFGRSFSRVTAVQGSGHFAGFIGQYQFNNTSQGVTPTFKMDQGLPGYILPPSINPAFSNGNTVDFWQGQEATRAPESLFWTFTIQRQMAANTVVEVGYNANVGTHLQTGVLNLNQVPTPVYHDMVSRFGVTQAQALLRGGITSAAVQNAGYRTPYANFTRNFSNPSLAQALRPYPMYTNINTDVQNGDKSGHSSYHAFVLKMDRRFSKGLTLNWNYVFSKLLTDSDSYFANFSGAMDQYNRRLEKSIGQFDQTHQLKFSTLYDLPFGKGQRWLNEGVLNQVLGGWRIAAIQVYSSGLPVALGRNNPLPLFNEGTRPYVTSYDDWRAPVGAGGFDPGRDRFLKPRSEFPVQPNDFGNVTRYNPKVRSFPNLNENISVAKTFRVSEIIRIDLRGEAFNLFNRTVFGTGSTSLDAATLGQVVNQTNTPRQMQVGLKVYW